MAVEILIIIIAFVAYPSADEFVGYSIPIVAIQAVIVFLLFRETELNIDMDKL